MRFGLRILDLPDVGVNLVKDDNYIWEVYDCIPRQCMVVHVSIARHHQQSLFTEKGSNVISPKPSPPFWNWFLHEIYIMVCVQQFVVYTWPKINKRVLMRLYYAHNVYLGIEELNLKYTTQIKQNFIAYYIISAVFVLFPILLWLNFRNCLPQSVFLPVGVTNRNLWQNWIFFQFKTLIFESRELPVYIICKQKHTSFLILSIWNHRKNLINVLI